MFGFVPDEYLTGQLKTYNHPPSPADFVEEDDSDEEDLTGLTHLTRIVIMQNILVMRTSCLFTNDLYIWRLPSRYILGGEKPQIKSPDCMWLHVPEVARPPAHGI